jgi:hypothetical protein
MFADGRSAMMRRFKRPYQPFVRVSAIYFGKGSNPSPLGGAGGMYLTGSFGFPVGFMVFAG